MLIDKAVARGFYLSPRVPDTESTTCFLELYEQGMEAFDITNVYSYWQDHRPDVGNALEVFPNVAPPFPVFWTEAQTNRGRIGAMCVAHDLTERAAMLGPERIAAYEQAFYDAYAAIQGEADGGRDEGERIYDAWTQVVFESHGKGIFAGKFAGPSILDGAAGLAAVSGTRWLLSIMPVTDVPKWAGPGIASPLLLFLVPIFGGGRIYTTRYGRIRAVLGDYGIEYGTYAAEQEGIPRDDYLAELYAAYRDAAVYPALMALSFLNCRNVVQERVDPVLTRQQRRLLERTGGTPPISYKVLNIEPMKRVLKSEGGIEATGIQRALHICRGHFAHYTEDRPLFGRVVGTIWRPAHVRGSADVGIADKDYRVLEPKGKRQ